MPDQNDDAMHCDPSFDADKPILAAEWDEFVDRSPQGSMYCKSWWLDAVCPEGYRLIGLRRSGQLCAGMALPMSTQGRRTAVRMPPLTQSLGPLLCLAPGQKYESQLTSDMRLQRRLIAKIPPVDDLFINCSQQYTNWLPFYWAGYSQTTRYSYVLEDLSNLQAVHDGMSDKTRNMIRKAERAGLRVEACDDLQDFLPVFEMTYRRQGIEFPYQTSMIERLDRALQANAKRDIIIARDTSGRIHAAVYVASARRRAYYVMLGTDPDLRNSGAAQLVHWHAIQHVSTSCDSYDFVGSMMENVEHAFRSFGAAQKPYFSITRNSPRRSWRKLMNLGRRSLRPGGLPAMLAASEWLVNASLATVDGVGFVTL